MPMPTEALMDLHNDLAKVRDTMETAQDIETRIALTKLEELLTSWRAALRSKRK